MTETEQGFMASREPSQDASERTPSSGAVTDLDPFTQGYVAELIKSYKPTMGCCGPIIPTFSDLAPETVERIVADCKGFLPYLNIPADVEAGGWLWGWRQGAWAGTEDSARRRYLRDFPPLTPYLGEDGLFYLSDGAGNGTSSTTDAGQVPGMNPLPSAPDGEGK